MGIYLENCSAFYVFAIRNAYKSNFRTSYSSSILVSYFDKKIHIELILVLYSSDLIIQSNVYFTPGGQKITIDRTPYQANYGDVCGAVIIHAKWLLTSAHCGERDFIRTGSKFRLKASKTNVKSHFVHPLYGRRHTFDYDVQLLELFRELHFGWKVGSIRISHGVCGSDVSVSGWGYSKEKGDYNDILKQVKIEIIPLEECQKIQNSFYNNTLTNTMFCAGAEDGDACQGDSGGAAVSYGQLIGISSFGYGCGRNTPGVYINVSHTNIRLWIRRFTGIYIIN
ncbi:trypsin-7-like isoform X2 [Pieris brassicae]|uniref:trypsin-7-like isoform X2 n=1 Tax=Pieris brassicae TaxID=7116 RepID=UPI001E660DB0|nr:trypsin-7-like isoform X2 [Pieris brassicae]